MKNLKLKSARAAKDYSQQQLADLVGVSRQTINAIEKGDYNPTVDPIRIPVHHERSTINAGNPFGCRMDRAFLFFIALFLVILVVRYARKVKYSFIVSTVSR